MRLAVFSDVHSNHHALKACLKEAEKQKADGYIFLGDYISDCANPHETMKLIYRAKQETPCWFVRGNREEYVLNHHNFGSDWANGTTTGSLLYTYEGLTAEDLEFISALPFMQTIDPNGKCPIRICHGSPEKTRDTLRPFSYKIESWLLKIDERVLLSGHTHQPCSAHTMGKLYVNPGAVGVQCTQTVTAKMALLDSDENTWNETLLEVPYDIDAAALEIRESGLGACDFKTALHRQKLFAFLRAARRRACSGRPRTFRALAASRTRFRNFGGITHEHDHCNA